jgi:hypothetical protein
VVENAIKYIIFLTNVNQLYDVALGMYDFKLVLMIAQYSQKVSKTFAAKGEAERYTGPERIPAIPARAASA